MAIRVRKDGRMFCAAHTAPVDGDTYIDDNLHYLMSVEYGVIVALPMPEHIKNPEWWWAGAAPEGADRWAVPAPKPFTFSDPARQAEHDRHRAASKRREG